MDALLGRAAQVYAFDYFGVIILVSLLESVVTTVWTLGAIAVLGAPPFAVFVSELLSTAIGFIEHANVRLPSWLDAPLRLVLVTPDMHRVHHSLEGRESQSNFGVTFPWWDRLFGTYIERPAAGRENMGYGVVG